MCVCVCVCVCVCQYQSGCVLTQGGRSNARLRARGLRGIERRLWLSSLHHKKHTQNIKIINIAGIFGYNHARWRDVCKTYFQFFKDLGGVGRAAAPQNAQTREV